jgi:hypothetical protein
MKLPARSSVLLIGLCALAACGNEKSSAPPGAASAPATSAPVASAPVALAPNAPKDQPVSAMGAKVDEIKAAMAPHIEEARRTYPDAKRRYLAGLPQGHVFFVVATLRDPDGAEEQVFVGVSGIQDGKVSGRISSDILGLRSYKRGDAYVVPEAELIDWVISRPDGSEEGNFVGKFLDDWQKRKTTK